MKKEQEQEQKSRRSFVGAAGINGRSIDFEINLAPVIDCLTVLIVYTMVSVSFLSLGSFSATVPSDSSSSASVAPAQIRVDLDYSRQIEITVQDGSTKVVRIPPVKEDWDLKSLQTKLAAFKSSYGDVSTITIAAQAVVPYRDVVRVVESSKQSFSNVVLGE